jgi:O-antigen/teichoic acid export membrane protein
VSQEDQSSIASNENDARPPSTSVESGVRRGLVWSLLGNAVLRLGTFATSLALARILDPDDFGTYAIGLTYLQFAIICNDVGVTSALVQWRGPFTQVIPTARSLTFLTTAVISGGMFAASAGLASFSGTSAASPVLQVLTIPVFLDGLMAVSTAQLWREFRQKQFMGASIAGAAVQAAVSISIALAGGGAMSFALGLAADAIVRSILISLFARVSFKPGFDRGVARRLAIFGLPLACGLALQAMLLNIDYVVISRTLDLTALGYYTLAFNISGWIPGVVGAALGTVTLAGFARIAEQGPEILSAAACRAFTVLIKTLLPAIAVLSVCAADVVSVAYGERWLPAAGALAWLSIYILPRMLAQTATELLVAQGRTRLPAVANLCWLAALLPALIVGARIAGIDGAAIAQVLAGCIVAIPVMVIALRRAGLELGGLPAMTVRPILGAIVGAACGAAVARVAAPSETFLTLALAAVAIVGIYCAVGLSSADRHNLAKWISRNRGPR